MVRALCRFWTKIGSIVRNMFRLSFISTSSEGIFSKIDPVKKSDPDLFAQKFQYWLKI